MIRPKVKKCRYPYGAEYWRVSYSLNGKQIIKRFSSEREANKYASKSILLYASGNPLEESKEMMRAYALFKSWSAKKESLNDISFDRFVDVCCEKWVKPVKLSVPELVDEFIARKEQENLRSWTLTQLKYFLNLFKADFKDSNIEDIDFKTLKDYIEVKYPNNKSRVVILKQFFSYLAGTSKKTKRVEGRVIEKSPLDYWSKTKTDEGTEHIVIWTVDECAELIREAQNYKAENMVAFLIFCGAIRPIEAENFWKDANPWQYIDLEKKTIRLEGKYSKVRKTRLIPINPTLERWLLKIKEDGYCLPPRWRKKYTEIRKAVPHKKQKDIARHTYISMCLADGGTFEDIAITCGNSKNIILKHYAGLISDKKEVRNFWALTPESFQPVERRKAV